MADSQAPRGERPAKGTLERLRGKLGRPPTPGEGQYIVAAYALITVALLLAPFVSTEIPDPTGTRPPLFSLPTTTGTTYNLASDLDARPIMIEFMHPNCSHCQNMGETLRSAHSVYGAQVAFVSVAIPILGVSTAQEVAAFKAQYGHDWTYCVSSDSRVSSDYGVTGTPTFIFINGSGLIHSAKVGEMTFSAMASELQAITGG